LHYFNSNTRALVSIHLKIQVWIYSNSIKTSNKIQWYWIASSKSHSNRILLIQWANKAIYKITNQYNHWINCSFNNRSNNSSNKEKKVNRKTKIINSNQRFKRINKGRNFLRRSKNPMQMKNQKHQRDLLTQEDPQKNYHQINQISSSKVIIKLIKVTVQSLRC
jgi:hypothetical protein